MSARVEQVKVGPLTLRRWQVVVAGILLLALVASIWMRARTTVEPSTPLSPKVLHEAQTFYNQKQYEKAIPVLEQYVTRGRKQVPLARDLLISSYWQTGKHDKAFEQQKIYLSTRPNDADGLFQLALLARELKRDQEAIGYLQQAVKLRPTQVQFRLLLADILAGSGRYLAAISQWQQALGLMPAQDAARPGVHLKIGHAYRLEQNPVAARDALQAGLEIDPANREIQAELKKLD